MFDCSFKIFHKAILSFFILVFVFGCGYKKPPFYSQPQNSDTNQTQMEK
ncbi:hypothetical protein CHAB381_0639 [Campylobacter hominis ATCC BAA-381]|uniref:Lipoprotein n=1 Tax=Campylobacter hominis (strain ATCC BAA-381 / DSM 21671 / CCUG 45161 / LMG 19568 / NCTC 13146 / CH001A) TaxID=360107 RepID=A7I132_CAMHC|nr:hypothetical protein CHAB381_0639 [Campylobacter hominis ATCC BAA-381]